MVHGEFFGHWKGDGYSGCDCQGVSFVVRSYDALLIAQLNRVAHVKGRRSPGSARVVDGGGQIVGDRRLGVALYLWHRNGGGKRKEVDHREADNHVDMHSEEVRGGSGRCA